MTVPTFVIGYPTFDRGAAAKYIARQLKLGGFDVRLISEYDMYVSWILPKKTKQKEERPDDMEFPDLMNLKKMANKYRRK